MHLANAGALCCSLHGSSHKDAFSGRVGELGPFKTLYTHPASEPRHDEPNNHLGLIPRHGQVSASLVEFGHPQPCFPVSGESSGRSLPCYLSWCLEDFALRLQV